MPRRTKPSPHHAFAEALRTARIATGLTQEDFGLVSSRIYISSLERGVSSPTLEKVEQLADLMGLHPASLVLLSYFQSLSPPQREQLWKTLKQQVDQHHVPVVRKRVRRPKG